MDKIAEALEIHGPAQSILEVHTMIGISRANIFEDEAIPTKIDLPLFSLLVVIADHGWLIW